MDNSSRMTTYGNLDLPEGTDERPLVTFALFAYNQEKYIREAVEGAFSQTYSPLEIILSDDCSSDRTFEIMQEMAAAYEGPHSVITMVVEKNAGLAAHINRVAGQARGEVVVVAAGDDISLGNRTLKLVETFQLYPDCFAAFSRYNIVGTKNPPVYQDTMQSRRVSAVELIMGAGGIQKGATYAYRKECFSIPAPIPDWVTSEDRILPLQAALLGHVHHTTERLVNYRVSDAHMDVLERQQRLLSHQNMNHWRLLFSTIKLAQSQRVISVKRGYLLGSLVIYSAAVAFIANMGPNARRISRILTLPTRLIRRICVWNIKP